MAITAIKKKQHIYADDSYASRVFATSALPWFEANKSVAFINALFALSAFNYSLYTKAKSGVLKFIPCKIHVGLYRPPARP